MAEGQLTTNVKKTKKTARGLTDVKRHHEDDTVTSVLPDANVYSSCVNVFRKQRHEMKEEWVKYLNSDQPVLIQHETVADTQPESPTKKKVIEVDYVKDALRSPSPPCLQVKPVKMTKKLHAILKNVEAITDSHLKQLAIEASKGIHSRDDSYTFEHGTEDSGQDVDDVICVNDEWSLLRKISVKINVLGQGNILRFDMQMKDHFGDVIKNLSQQCDIDPKRGILLYNDKTVKQTDTPASIGLHFCDTLEFGILPDSATVVTIINTSEQDRDVITLKLQSQNSRAKAEMTAKKHEPISKLMNDYAVKYEKDISKLVFKFDGDVLDAESTVDELELEDGFCLDVVES